jgi:hypothetical protein
MMKTSFFLSRQTLLPSAKPGMAIWREKLFAWMLRNAASAMEFFRLPTNRVVELGSQVDDFRRRRRVAVYEDRDAMIPVAQILRDFGLER